MNVKKKAPVLILTGGLPASGKTWFAKALAGDLGADYLSSDALRTAMNLRGHYDAASKHKVYEALLVKGEVAVSSGKTTVVDSTFYKESLRMRWRKLAEKYGVPFYFIVIEVPENIARLRLRENRKDSEATWEVYKKLKSQWEKPEQPHLVFDSHRQSLAEMLGASQKYLFAE